ncbi:MAG: oxidative damage protection protein [bacterium]|nr:oxidative damage protection protein [bacterium]
MSRIIYCCYLKKEAEGLSELPFPGPVGQEIFAKVSMLAWNEWREMQTKIINEYRLDLSEAADRQKLLEQMRNFLCLDGDLSKKNMLHVGTPTNQ